MIKKDEEERWRPTGGEAFVPRRWPTRNLQNHLPSTFVCMKIRLGKEGSSRLLFLFVFLIDFDCFRRMDDDLFRPLFRRRLLPSGSAAGGLASFSPRLTRLLGGKFVRRPPLMGYLPSLPAGFSRLFGSKFMRCSLFMRRFPPLSGDLSLFLRIHCGKAALAFLCHFIPPSRPNEMRIRINFIILAPFSKRESSCFYLIFIFNSTSMPVGLQSIRSGEGVRGGLPVIRSVLARPHPEEGHCRAKLTHRCLIRYASHRLPDKPDRTHHLESSFSSFKLLDLELSV